MRKGIMALEGIDAALDNPEVPAENVDVESVAEFVEGPETALIETSETEAEIQDMDRGIEVAVDTADTLEEVATGLDKVAEEGGLSEAAAETMETAIEHMLLSIGMSKERIKPLALEAFQDKATRGEATLKLAREAESQAKAVWAGIVNAFKQAIEMVKKFFAGMLDTAERLKQRAEKLAKAADAKKGSVAKADAMVKAGKFANVLNVDGEVPTGDAMVSKFDEFAKSSAVTNAADMASNAQKLSDAVTKLVDSVSDGEKFQSVWDETMKQIGAAEDQEKANEKIDLVFGQQQLLIERSKVFGLRYTLKTAEGAKEVKAEEVAPLNPVAAGKLANAVAKHLGAVQAFKKQAAEIDAVQKKALATATKAQGLFGGLSNSDESKRARQVSDLARGIIKLTTTSVAQLRSYDLKVSKAALDYVAVSVGAVEAKTEEGTKQIENALPA